MTVDPREIERLQGVAGAIEVIAVAVAEGRATGDDLDEAIVQLRGVRHRLFGSRRAPGSARSRIGALLVARAGLWVTGDELAEVAGISEWARRVRELRASGWEISELNGTYRLDGMPPS